MPQIKRKKGAYTNADTLQLVKSGEEYFSLLEKLINEAKESVHLQVYIFNENATGLRIADALSHAAERSVKVYLIVDDYASEDFSDDLMERFKTSGVLFRRFEPLLQSDHFYFGRRLHHKVVVVDEKRALVGGINISDRYNDMPGSPAWFDRALYMEGMVAKELLKVCCDVWNKAFDKTNKIKLPVQQPDADTDPGPVDHYSVRVRVNDWVRRQNEISRSYLEMFNHAEHSILIVCSYFMPGRSFRMGMDKAIKRGVKIRVVLGGRSDVALSKYAERYLYRWMLDRGIEIYEYQKNILHAKLAMSDNNWMTIGSYNVNDISALASVELNIDVRNTHFVTKATQSMEQVIQEDCTQITYDNYKVTTGWLKQTAQFAAYQLVKAMLFAVTFYYKRQEA